MKHTHTFHGYGVFPGGDPRNFTPDGECSTEEERANHKAACEQWDNGSKLSKPDCLHSEGIVLTMSQFGLGMYSITEECNEEDCKVDPDMIRPSSLQLAEKCSHFIELQEKFPETSANAERGNVVDEQNTNSLLQKAEADDPDAIACLVQLEKIRSFLTAGMDPSSSIIHYVQSLVRLIDPDTDSLLTEGTPDVQLYVPDGLLVTVDWKKREQYFSGYITEPDDNLQLHAYSIARALEVGAMEYANVLIIFGDGEAEAIHSKVFYKRDWVGYLDRIRKIQGKPTTAAPGAHCSNCWQRWVCGSYRERAKLALTLLDGTVGDGTMQLTDDTAALLIERAEHVEAAAKLAKDIARAHYRGGGKIVKDGKKYVPVMCKGRASGNLDLLRKEGLTQYIKEGAPYERWQWRNIK